MPPGEMAPSRAERRLGESIGERGRLPARLPAALDVEVLTVDACQGSEFEYVLLSTVRHPGRAGARQTRSRVV